MACTLNDVIEKYNQGDYEAITGMCGELIERKENIKEAVSYTIKAAAHIVTPACAESKKSFLEYLGVGLEQFSTLKELVELEIEVMSILKNNRLEKYSEALAVFVANPTEEGNKEFRKFATQELMYPYELHLSFANKEKVFADKMGKTVNEINAEYGFDFSEVLDVDVKPLQYKAGCEMIDNAITYLDGNRAGVFERCKSILLEYMTAEICGNSLIDMSCPKADEVTAANKKEYIQKLLRKAYPLNYLLTTSVYPDGNEMPIVKFATDMARTQLDELKQIYDKIKDVDPNYELPPLPDVPSATTTSSGCYVATAVYGSYDCPQLWTLRRYRDYTLMPTWYGRAFVHTYYAVSPTLVKLFGDCDWFKNMFKPKLEKMVKNLNEKGVEDTPYDDLNW